MWLKRRKQNSETGEDSSRSENNQNDVFEPGPSTNWIQEEQPSSRDNDEDEICEPDALTNEGTTVEDPLSTLKNQNYVSDPEASTDDRTFEDSSTCTVSSDENDESTSEANPSEESVDKPRSYKRTSDRSNYCKEKLEEAVRKVQSGVFTGYEAAVRYNIPRSTIMDHVTGRYGKRSKTIRKPPLLPEDLELKLAENIRFMAAHGFCLSIKELLVLIAEYVRCSKTGKVKGLSKTKNPGMRWFQTFAGRNGGIDPQPKGEKEKKEADFKKVKEYFALLKKVTGELKLSSKPGNVWNIEETCFRITRGGCARTNNTDEKRNATVLIACNAAGQKAPLLIVFKEKEDSDEQDCYTVTKVGWLDRETFRNYFTKSFLTALRDVPPILITFNGYSANIDMKLIEETRRSEMIFLRTPFQRDLSVFNRLKFKWDSDLNDWQQEHIGCEIPENVFTRILTSAFNEFTRKEIRRGFRNAGLYPLNDSICSELYDPQKHTTLFYDSDIDDDDEAGADEFETVHPDPVVDPIEVLPIRTDVVKQENTMEEYESDELSSKSSVTSESESSSGSELPEAQPNDSPPSIEKEVGIQTLPLPKKRKHSELTETRETDANPPLTLRQLLQQPQQARTSLRASQANDARAVSRSAHALPRAAAPATPTTTGPITRQEASEIPRCALRYCSNTSQNTNKSTETSFHRFVKKDSDYFKSWLKFVRLDRREPNWYPTEHTYLCSKHFREADFIITNTGRNLLKKSAVPCFASKHDALHPESSQPNANSSKNADASQMGSGAGFNWDASKNSKNSKTVVKERDKASKRVEEKQDFELLIKSARTVSARSMVCCVFGCRNNSNDNMDKRFFHFPTDQQKRSEWLKLINREDLASKLNLGSTDSRVCSDHFDEYDYTLGALSQDAVPHLGLPKKRAKFVYAPDYDAGPSGLPAKEVKLEPTDSDAMDVEIQFEPEEPPTIKFNAPTIPIATAPTINFRPTIQPPLIVPQTIVTQTNVPQTIILPTLVTMWPSNVQTPNIEPILRPVIPTTNVTTVRPTGMESLPVIQNTFNIVEKEHDIFNKTRTGSRFAAFLKRATIAATEQINLPPTPPVRPEMSSIHVQTTKKLIDLMNMPMQKKYLAEKREDMKKIRTLEKELNNPKMDKQKFLECCDKFLDEEVANIVKSQAKLLDKYQGNRYSSSFKTFALNLYLCSPQSYKFVEQLFYLPSLNTLQRFQIPIKTGINPNLIEGLKVKVDEMSEKEKICTVCFDYMGVNRNLYYDMRNDYLCGIQSIDQVLGSEPAQFAPLIMVRGLYTKWTQPVSFALFSKKVCYPALRDWLMKIIAMLLDLGLKVKAFVADFDSKFLDFSDVSATEPFIEVNEQKIYQIFDVPNLYKNARDDLMNYDFHIGSKVAKWSHLLKAYEIDKKQELSLMLKITEQHIRPDEESKNDVKKAIQVFSRAVAAAMNFHVIANMTHKKTKDTVEFIKTMNNLFDMLNSRNIVSDNEFKQTYKGTDEQKQFLFSTLEYLQMLEMKDKAGNIIEERMTFVTGLVITIKSVMALHEDLLEENLRYIATKNLGKDCMETYFKKVRQLGGNCCSRPTPIMFTRSFRRLFLRNLVSNTKEGGTVIDLKSILTKVSEYVKSEIKDDPEPNRSLNVGTSDYQHLWPIPPITYLAGYLLWKILERHACPKMIESLNKHYNIEVEGKEDGKQLLSILKEFNGDNVKRKDMPTPPEALVEFVEKMDDIFNEYYRRADMEAYSFGWNVYLTMEGETFDMPCECFPLKSLKFLFIRMKIFQTVKDYNWKNRPMRKNWKGIRKRVPKDH